MKKKITIQLDEIDYYHLKTFIKNSSFKTSKSQVISYALWDFFEKCEEKGKNYDWRKPKPL